MSKPPETYDPEICAHFLRDLGASGEPILPIAEAALALASFERPRVGPARYREHLHLLVQDVARHAGGPRNPLHACRPRPGLGHGRPRLPRPFSDPDGRWSRTADPRSVPWRP